MNREQWTKLKVIFDRAQGLDPSSQVSLLDRECAANLELRDELQALLEASSMDSPFMERCAMEEHDIDLLRVLEKGLTGERIGPWRVLHEIGTGGMGTVYLAEREDGVYQTQVALKIIRRGMDSAVLLRRFRQERQILASLNHPGIARLIDGGMCPDGRPYLAVEFIEGCAIDDYCDKHNLPVRDILELFLQVCDAVQFAHQHLVVHRDIKPQNILVTDLGAVRLLDFGVAKLLGGNFMASDLNLTCAGERVWTPQYASPEQVRGDFVTVATDVYALGVLLYRLLTKTHPYQADSVEELNRAICEQDPPVPSSLIVRGNQRRGKRLTSSRDLDLITLQALRKEPSRRYQSVEQLAEDLRRYLRLLPVSARPDSASYRLSRFVSRHRAGVAAAASILIALSLGIGATVWQAGVAEQQRARAERRSAETRQIAKSFLFELYDALREIPGTTGARALVAQKGTELFRELSREADSDLNLRRELAAGYLKLASIKGGAARPNIGDGSGAQGDYERSIRLYESLIRSTAHPQADDQYGLSTAYSAMAAAVSPGGSERSENWALKARGSDLEGIRLWPADLRFRKGLAHDLQQIGANRATHGDLAGDLEEHEKALGILKVLVTRKNAEEDDWLRVSFAHKRVGAILINLNRLPEALGHYQVALSIDQDLLRKKPNDASKRIAITYALNDIGYIYGCRREFGRALQYYQQGLSIREALALADPKDARVKGSLGNSWFYVGGILQQQGDLGQALAFYSKCLASRKSNPPTSEYQLEVAEVLSAMGSAHAAKASKEKTAGAAPGDWLRAQTEFANAMEIYTRLGVSSKKFALSEKERARAEAGLAEAKRNLTR